MSLASSGTSSISSLISDALVTIVDALSEGVLIVDNCGIIQHMNDAARRLYQGGDVPKVGVSLADSSPHDWIEVRKVLATGISQRYSLLRLPEATVLVNRTPVIVNGGVVGAVVLMQDIDNFRPAVAEFGEYRNLLSEFETTIDRFDDIFLSVNSHGIIRTANSAYERFVTLGRQSILGRHLETIRRSPKQLVALFGQALSSGTQASMQIPLPYGQTSQGFATPTFDDSGRIIRILLQLKTGSGAVQVRDAVAAEAPAPLPSVELQRLCHASGFTVHSAVMNKVVQQALKVAKTNACVLITGESGVGKSMLASLIHDNSPRKDQAFVVINCGAIPGQLLESELFGYEKGAFTGANAHGKQGLIETADKGTLFLDEIGELQFSLQSKLLDLFEKKSFLKVGGTRRISVDIRIIAATNRNLEEDVRQGRFRQDLFYRLNVIPICIPALRDRPEDVRAMIQQLIGRYNEQNDTCKAIDPELLAWLLHYPFEGNMRELVNILEWLLVMSEGDAIHLSDLPTRLRSSIDRMPFPGTRGSVEAAPPAASVDGVPGLPSSETVPAMLARRVPLKDALTAFERDYLRQAMATYGSIQAVADALDVHFSTLWRKLVKFGLIRKGDKTEDDG